MDFAERNLLSGIWSKSFGNFDSWMGMVIATNAVKTEEETLEIPFLSPILIGHSHFTPILSWIVYKNTVGA